MIRAALATLATVAIAGCVISSDYSGTEYQCPDGVCPSGFDCVMGQCVTGMSTDARADGDAQINGDAQTNGDGGVPAAHCGGPGTFMDDFGTSDLPWAIVYNSNGANVNITGGELVVDLPSDPGGSADGEVFASRRFDLRGSRVTLEVVEMVNPAEQSAAELIINADWNDYVEFYQIGGSLHLNQWINDTLDSEVELAWDAALYRWWQLREDQGTLYFETSPNGQDWTVRTSITSPPYLDRAQFYMSAETSPGITSPGRARFDNLNVAAGSEPWCKIATFADDFADNDIGLYWEEWEDDCALVQQNGYVELVAAPNLTGSCGIDSTTGHDLRDSAMHVEVPQMVNTSSDAVAYLIVTDRNGRGATFVQQAGTLSMTHCTPSCNSVSDLSYDAAAHRWWRFRESGGTLYYEASPDGNDWSELTSISHSFDAADVGITMGVSNPGADPAPGTLRFDNLNE